jgi:hypothetical protein
VINIIVSSDNYRILYVFDSLWGFPEVSFAFSRFEECENELFMNSNQELTSGKSLSFSEVV